MAVPGDLEPSRGPQPAVLHVPPHLRLPPFATTAIAIRTTTSSPTDPGPVRSPSRHRSHRHRSTAPKTSTSTTFTHLTIPKNVRTPSPHRPPITSSRTFSDTLETAMTEHQSKFAAVPETARQSPFRPRQPDPHAPHDSAPSQNTQDQSPEHG